MYYDMTTNVRVHLCHPVAHNIIMAIHQSNTGPKRGRLTIDQLTFFSSVTINCSCSTICMIRICDQILGADSHSLASILSRCFTG
jgi:hypothetical protein